MTLGQAFLNSAIKRLTYYKELGDKTFAQLDGADFHISPDTESNSIEMIIKHMNGNMLSRWTDFLTTDGEKDGRNRDAEFEDEKLDREALLTLWEKGWACCLGALGQLKEDDLEKIIYIRSEALLAVDAINRQLAHYPYHVGQIVYIGRMLKGSAWKSLSIPKGQSNQYNSEMRKK
jgi:Protein of unknown function (DUF1572)